jgi:hypothetical protein
MSEEQPQIQAQSVVWQGNEYEEENENFEPNPVTEENIEPNEPDVREQAGKLWRGIKHAFHALLAISLFVLGGYVGWSICTYQYQAEATKTGAAHWDCDSTTGERIFQWNEKN